MALYLRTIYHYLKIILSPFSVFSDRQQNISAVRMAVTKHFSFVPSEVTAFRFPADLLISYESLWTYCMKHFDIMYHCLQMFTIYFVSM